MTYNGKLPPGPRSPLEWDGRTVYSTATPQEQHHQANCSLCGRTVAPSDREAWYRAIITLVCVHCGGRLMIENPRDYDRPAHIPGRKP